ncbi:hypothetical protein [Methylobacterium brachiatum]|uniref:hypothetical protein n=1 Tax=Methylobacterium brachiatum TaxID=269660 RepID=UPI0033149913
MSERRSISQVMFGYLPEQTVDVRGGVWRVQEWRGAIVESNIDDRALRKELCRLARQWAGSGRDGGFVADLERNRARIVVKSLDKARGVHLRRFPEIWYCRRCRRMHDALDARCNCGSSERKGQLQFVMYCEDTGELREPSIRRCQTHNASRITFPGTASGGEIRFDCPECGQHLRNGLGFSRSSSGAVMKANVHRAASVYTPRSVVVVNPPSPSISREIEQAGGGRRALDWVLDGMSTRSMTDVAVTGDTLRERLLASGLAADLVEQMVAMAASQGGLAAGGPASLVLADDVRESAEEQALSVAVAMAEGRTTIADLASRTDALTERGHRYHDRYPVALSLSGLERVDLVERFPVLTGHFGYTRGNPEPGAARLNTFRERRGAYVVYGAVAVTEALYFALDPAAVARWLAAKGYALEAFSDARSARISLLRAMAGGGALVDDVTTLVHSYAHRLIRMVAVHAGIELSSLSELLLPTHLSFFVYAAARGDFVLGGLQALFENDLDRLLRQFVDGEHRCALDPGCARGGGACMACLHLGEPSCRLFNGKLDRRTLTGPEGYLTILPL